MREKFKEEGYLLLKGFFERDEIKQLRQLLGDLLVKHQRAKWEGEYLKALQPVHRIGSEGFYQILKEILSVEKMHSIANNQKLKKLLTDLLGKEIFAHPRKMFRITYPYEMNPKDRIPEHQDIFYVQGEVDTFTCWTPLGDITSDAGGLEVAPGTHKRGLFPTNSNEEGRFQCTTADISEENISWVKPEYEMGDLLIMHSLTLHRAGYNLTDNFRISVDCRFSAVDGYINEEQLLPPYHTSVPDWNELTDAWLDKKNLEVPESLKIERADTSLDLILSRESAFTELCANV